MVQPRIDCGALLSCWHGSRACAPGWRIAPGSTPSPPPSQSWMSSETTGGATSPPASRTRPAWRPPSTPSRRASDSATDRRTFPPRENSSRYGLFARAKVAGYRGYIHMGNIRRESSLKTACYLFLAFDRVGLCPAATLQSSFLLPCDSYCDIALLVIMSFVV